MCQMNYTKGVYCHTFTGGGLGPMLLRSVILDAESRNPTSLSCLDTLKTYNPAHRTKRSQATQSPTLAILGDHIADTYDLLLSHVPARLEKSALF